MVPAAVPRVMRGLCLGLLLPLLLAGCGTVPLTGRQQMLLMSEQEERALGARAFRDYLAKAAPSRDPAHRAQVTRVGQRIAAATGRTDLRWEFRVVVEEQVNAFCLPGGKVVVNTGLLERVGDDDELAAVIGHEAAHAIARHGAERASQEMLAGLGLSVAAGIIGARATDSAAAGLAIAALGAGATVGILLPYSRLHESEADRMGLIYMARAGYDPRAAARFWRRMQAMEGRGGTPEFLSTHPADATRIAGIEAALPEALSHYRPAASGTR